MPSASSTFNVGLAVGHGTGVELETVFRETIQQLSDLYRVSVQITRSPRLYHSYFSLEDHFSSDPAAVSDQSQLDVDHYLEWCTSFAQAHSSTVSSYSPVEGLSHSPVVFRTAMNAQSLYRVRQCLEGVKVERFFQCHDRKTNGQLNGNSNSGEMILIRDMAQGFYSGTNRHDQIAGTVTRNTTFSKHVMERLLDYALERAHQLWGGSDKIDRVLLVYKFHLFDGVLSAWAKEWSAARGGVTVQFVQPDTANRNLLAYGIQGKQVVLAGNEWADIMHVILLHMFGNVAQEERCTENVYLNPSVCGLVEYQTVHGSADDIAGKGLVNPSATMRAVAAILERFGGCKGAIADMEQAMGAVEAAGVGTGDQKRAKRVGTKQMVESIMNAHKASSEKDV